MSPSFLSFLLFLFFFFFHSSVLCHSSTVHFACIGDYGSNTDGERGVSEMVHRWDPEFIITTGDNNYWYGEQDTIDDNIGQYYHDYIDNYKGRWGQGSKTRRFYPSLGNHDWDTRSSRQYPAAYLDYFGFSDENRYYSFNSGSHPLAPSRPLIFFFALDSDPREPDKATSNSKQAQWLWDQLSAIKAEEESLGIRYWKIAYFHHPPYSSSHHGSNPDMEWRWEEHGIDIILSGHDHCYERIKKGNSPVTYIVNGAGGQMLYPFGIPVDGSIIRYNASYGAQNITVTADRVQMDFYNINNELIDSVTINSPMPYTTLPPVTTTTSTLYTTNSLSTTLPSTTTPLSTTASPSIENYSWTTTQWSDCPTNCTSFDQTREVYCQSSIRGKVADAYCQITEKPSSSQPCPLSNCPSSSSGTSAMIAIPIILLSLSAIAGIYAICRCRNRATFSGRQTSDDTHFRQDGTLGEIPMENKNRFHEIGDSHSLVDVDIDDL